MHDVETRGVIEKSDIPFVVGVLADLSGQLSRPLPKLKHRLPKSTATISIACGCELAPHGVQSPGTSSIAVISPNCLQLSSVHGSTSTSRSTKDRAGLDA